MLLSGNANSAHPLVQSSTGGSAEPVVDDLHRRAGNLATLGLQQPLTAVEPGVVGASTGMPRMVNCLPNTRGRLVPSFVDMFSAPSTSVVWSSDSIGSTLEPGFTSLPSTLPSSLDTVAHPLGIGLASLPLPGNVLSPFIVGPGYAPVPAKTVNAIVTGKFINLGDLLPDNALALDEVTEPQLLLDGRLVLTGAARKPRKEIRDILSWVEAFTVFSVILGSHSPHRWRDLASYKLLILRTYRQFSGSAWCDYDKAFRQHAAAVKLTDWSELNVQLFNFHTAGSGLRGNAPSSGPRQGSSFEPQGTSNSDCSVICLSWNKGQCVARTAVCRFRHVCVKCFGPHRELECRVTTPLEVPSPHNASKKRRF